MLGRLTAFRRRSWALNPGSEPTRARSPAPALPAVDLPLGVATSTFMECLLCSSDSGWRLVRIICFIVPVGWAGGSARCGAPAERLLGRGLGLCPSWLARHPDSRPLILCCGAFGSVAGLYPLHPGSTPPASFNSQKYFQILSRVLGGARREPGFSGHRGPPLNNGWGSSSWHSGCLSIWLHRGDRICPRAPRPASAFPPAGSQPPSL